MTLYKPPLLDKHGFLIIDQFENPKLYPDGIILKFFSNLEKHHDSHLNIIQHFHQFVNDNQIREIKKYFQDYHHYWQMDIAGTEELYEAQFTIYHERNGKIEEDFVMIAIENDEFFNEYRIV